MEASHRRRQIPAAHTQSLPTVSIVTSLVQRLLRALIVPLPTRSVSTDPAISQEFDLGTNYVSATFNFVPSGGQVTVVRDVIRSQSCNKCHDEVSAHGGSRRGVEMCVLCHTPQTTDPDTGNTVDFPAMIHKIHAGSDCRACRQVIRIGSSGSEDLYSIGRVLYSHRTFSGANPVTNRTRARRRRWPTSQGRRARHAARAMTT